MVEGFEIQPDGLNTRQKRFWDLSGFSLIDLY